MFKTHFEELKIDTHDLMKTAVPNIGWLNITSEVVRTVAYSCVRDGIVIVQSNHTTAGILLNESEEGLIAHDLPKLLSALVPEEGDYKHDDAGRLLTLPPGEPKNGPGHMRTMLGAKSEILRIVHDSKIILGSWQSILFFDFDPLSHPGRIVAMQVLGLAKD